MSTVVDQPSAVEVAATQPTLTKEQEKQIKEIAASWVKARIRTLAMVFYQIVNSEWEIVKGKFAKANSYISKLAHSTNNLPQFRTAAKEFLDSEILFELDRALPAVYDQLKLAAAPEEEKVAEEMVHEQLRAAYLYGPKVGWEFKWEKARDEFNVILPSRLVYDVEPLLRNHHGPVSELPAEQIQKCKSHLLGPFTVKFRFQEIGGDGRIIYNIGYSEAVEEGGYAGHPHVRGGALCEGEGRTAVAGAMRDMRLFDILDVINSVLSGYNPGDAYWRFSQGPRDGRAACRNCSRRLPAGELVNCGACSGASCTNCIVACPDCNRHYCGGCMRTCKNPDCDRQGRCPNCMQRCPCGMQLCKKKHGTKCTKCTQLFCAPCLIKRKPTYSPTMCMTCNRQEEIQASLRAGPTVQPGQVGAVLRPDSPISELDLTSFIAALNRSVDPYGYLAEISQQFVQDSQRPPAAATPIIELAEVVEDGSWAEDEDEDEEEDSWVDDENDEDEEEDEDEGEEEDGDEVEVLIPGTELTGNVQQTPAETTAEAAAPGNPEGDPGVRGAPTTNVESATVSEEDWPYDDNID